MEINLNSIDADQLPLKQQETEKIARMVIEGGQKNDPSDLHKAVKEFESYFIAYLLTEMRNTVKPGLLPNKDGKQFYSFYDQEIGRLAAQAGGLGLADMLERSLAHGIRPTNTQPSQVSPHSSDKIYEWDKFIPH